MEHNVSQAHPVSATQQRLDFFSAERMVYDAISSGKAQPDDIRALMDICRLSEFKVSVALQLLSYKNLIPPY